VREGPVAVAHATTQSFASASAFTFSARGFFTCRPAGAGSSAFVQNSTRAGIMLNISSTSNDYIIE
jgi:hypothetical protein